MDQSRRKPHQLQEGGAHPRRPHPHGPTPPRPPAQRHDRHIINFVAKEIPHSGRPQTLESVPQSRTRTDRRRLHAGTKVLDAALRAWRKAEAAKTGKPAFIVFSDAVLHNVVLACPTRLAELQTVSGIGPEKADRYGADIIAICRLEAPGPRNTSDSSDKEAASRPKAASYAAAVGGPPHSAMHHTNCVIRRGRRNLSQGQHFHAHSLRNP